MVRGAISSSEIIRLSLTQCKDVSDVQVLISIRVMMKFLWRQRRVLMTHWEFTG